jgi:hypothetical protein
MRIEKIDSLFARPRYSILPLYADKMNLQMYNPSPVPVATSCREFSPRKPGIKYLLPKFSRYGITYVNYLQHKVARISLNVTIHRNVSGLVSVFNRVVEEVHEHLAKQLSVRMYFELRLAISDMNLHFFCEQFPERTVQRR